MGKTYRREADDFKRKREKSIKHQKPSSKKKIKVDLSSIKESGE